jgi:hypothetical protein
VPFSTHSHSNAFIVQLTQAHSIDFKNRGACFYFKAIWITATYQIFDYRQTVYSSLLFTTLGKLHVAALHLQFLDHIATPLTPVEVRVGQIQKKTSA